MARTGNPERKGELLDQIMEYLVGVPLAQASFRALADALGVSTFALVYHFGNREQLDHEILGVVRQHQREILEMAEINSLDAEEYTEFARRAWEETISRRGLLASRLSFEAGVTESLRTTEGASAILREVNDGWVRTNAGWLEANGVASETALFEAELFVNAQAGIRYRLHLDGDFESASRSADEAVRRFVRLIG